jgi:hypothetical protein
LRHSADGSNDNNHQFSATWLSTLVLDRIATQSCSLTVES